MEEIERFAAAGKRVLLYFSDEQFNLSQIDLRELESVQEFRRSMERSGLYKTFKDLREFKTTLRDDLETALGDVEPMLISAGKALAYGYFKNFISRAYDALKGFEVELPEYEYIKNGKVVKRRLSFSKYRIRIAMPGSLDDATDATVSLFNRGFLIEIDIKTAGMRRALRIHVPIELREYFAAAKEQTEEILHLDKLDVIDFPTPMIALNDFVQVVEKALIELPKTKSRYWHQQKDVQYKDFEDYLKQRVKGENIPYIEYFYLQNSDEFKLPP